MDISIIKAMKTHIGKIDEVVIVDGETCLRLECAALDSAMPGQFVQAYSVDTSELLPTQLYPCGHANNHLFCGKIPRSWEPGVELHLRGPRGNGFHLPPLARRVALTTLDVYSPNRLLGLADHGIKNGAAVTLFTDRIPLQLAPEIEVLPLSELPQVKTWADYMAAALILIKLSSLKNQLGLPSDFSRSLNVEICLELPMICDENSACGACAVETVKGWKLACKDGPVFNLQDLAGGEEGHA